MKLEHTVNSDIMKCAARAHFDYRFPVKRFIEPIVGLLIIIFGLYSIFTHTNAVGAAIGGSLIVVGAVIACRRELYSTRASRMPFKGKPDTIAIQIEVVDDGLRFRGPSSDSMNSWNSFVDLHVLSKGVLLYPQYELFIWVPSDSILTDGTWDNFIEVLEKNIKKSA